MNSIARTLTVAGLLLATSTLKGADHWPSALQEALSSLYIPYGQYEITQRQFVSHYGSGCIIRKEHADPQHIYFLADQQMWIKCLFSGDEPGLPLRAIILSRTAMCDRKLSPKTPFVIPGLVTSFYGLSEGSLRKRFKATLIPTSLDDYYGPKTSGPSLKPKIAENTVIPIEFDFQAGAVATIRIYSP